MHASLNSKLGKLIDPVLEVWRRLMRWLSQVSHLWRIRFYRSCRCNFSNKLAA